MTEATMERTTFTLKAGTTLSIEGVAVTLVQDTVLTTAGENLTRINPDWIARAETHSDR